MLIGNSVSGFFTLKCPTSAQQDKSSQLTLHESADGSRSASVFGGIAPLREWSIDYSVATPGELRLLYSMSTDPAWYAPELLQFLPPGGEKQNMLTYKESMLSDVTGYISGIVNLDDGSSHLGFVLTGGNRVTIATNIPVPATGEKRMTFTVYAKGSTIFRITYKDAAGKILKQAGYGQTGGTDTYSRVSFPYVEVAGATSVDFAMEGGSFTLPAVTIGKDVYAWEYGQRLESVVVRQGSTSILAAWGKTPASAVYTSDSFTITELRKGYQ